LERRSRRARRTSSGPVRPCAASFPGWMTRAARVDDGCRAPVSAITLTGIRSPKLRKPRTASNAQRVDPQRYQLRLHCAHGFALTSTPLSAALIVGAGLCRRGAWPSDFRTLPGACGDGTGLQRAGARRQEAIMAKKSSRRLSEPERAERRRQDRERLQQAARELLSSEGWARWVRTRAMFHAYCLVIWRAGVIDRM
jgi:hypothetical protein